MAYIGEDEDSSILRTWMCWWVDGAENWCVLSMVEEIYLALYMEELGEMYEIWIIDPNHSKPSAHPKDPFFNSWASGFHTGACPG